MTLIALGINHKSAPIEVREQVSCSSDAIEHKISELLKIDSLSEAVLLSTCNRTELYLDSSNLYSILRWIKSKQQLQFSILKKHSYALFGEMAIRHLFRVASGLDSMVLGEAQILGQLKAAYYTSVKTGGINKFLGRLFQHSFSIAKQVRSETAIGVNPTSIAKVAVKLATRIFTDVGNATVLLVGAGDTAKVILQHLSEVGVKKVLLANRTKENAELMITGINNCYKVEFMDLESIPTRLAEADIVISSTASPLPIIGKGMIERAIKIRRHRPLYVVDIAVPRDVEPEVSQLEDVYLYCIDDLKSMASEYEDAKDDALQQAEEIINEGVENFIGWSNAQDNLDVLLDFRSKFVDAKEQAVNTALHKLRTGKNPEDVIQHMGNVLINKLLHDPTMQIRKAAFNKDQDFLEKVCELFKV